MRFLRNILFRIYIYARQLGKFLAPMQIPLHSAYTCFYLVLSLFPCMLLLLGLLRYTPLGVTELLSFLEGLLPEAIYPTAELVVEASYSHSSGAVVSVSAVAALWSASRGMFGLVAGLNAVYGRTRQKNYVGQRLLCMAYTFFFLLALVSSLLIHVLSKSLTDYLLMTTQPGILRLLTVIDLPLLVLMLVLTGLFAGMYAWLPKGKNRFRGSLPGAAVASIGWLASSRLFGVYMGYFSRYTNIYGSLYGLALGMLWLYFCINLIFYAGVLNRALLSKN